MKDRELLELAAKAVGIDLQQQDAMRNVERDAARYRFLRNQQSWGNVIYEAIGYGGGEDFDKAIDATMGFTPQEVSPSLYSDAALRKTEAYRLGYMEGMAKLAADIKPESGS